VDDIPDTQPEAVCPWTFCQRCARPLRPEHIEYPCRNCAGLGLILTSDWLASSWSILFMCPDESLDGRTPDDFLRLVLDPVYPKGGYRVMPSSHPSYMTAVQFTHDDLVRSHVAHVVADPAKGIFRVGGLIRHLRVVLIERPPTRELDSKSAANECSG
jgi:hypothetical protein